MKKLPIYDVLEDIEHAFESSFCAILQASAGAGKSTVVPLHFLQAPWLNNQQIIVLEPRRMAARMVATRMAQLLNEEVGQQVGYQIKQEHCYTKNTRILVVTEAILVRKLQADQSLDGVAMIIFDEFHERSIHTDTSLALALQVQQLLREDLRLLIMSATLNIKQLKEKFALDAPIIESSGRMYPIEEIYLNGNIKQPSYKELNAVVVQTIHKALDENDGDILVFLPGIKNIMGIEKMLKEEYTSLLIVPLHSSVSKKQQDHALKPSSKRKIILSTNIAQTSLTIEGIRIVIDSGLHKMAYYSKDTGMNFLKEQFISQDDATQRAGRAGRLEAGVCYKLWHKGKQLNAFNVPEIQRVDITSFCLDIALWGSEVEELNFLDYPSSEHLAATRTLLHELQMLDGNNTITAFGKKALSLGTHPRLAFMMLKAKELGHAYEGCVLAALLENKDIFVQGNASSNLYERFMSVLLKEKGSYINGFVFSEVLKSAQNFYARLKGPQPKGDVVITQEFLGALLLFAYPDRLAMLRHNNQNKYKLSNAKGALLRTDDELFNAPLLVVATLHAHEKDSFIQSCIPIDMKHLQKYFDFLMKKDTVLMFNSLARKFELKEETSFLNLVLITKGLPLDKHMDLTQDILSLLKKEGLALLSFDKKVKTLQQRVACVQGFNETFSSIDDEYLLTHLDTWLVPYLGQIHDFASLERLDFYGIILSILSWEEQCYLKEHVPTHVSVPSGSKIAIDYSKEQPILAVRLQEMFGLHQSPCILQGKLTLQLHLLSPARRPIQITHDLKSFWETAYAEVRKELRGKYKKHYWPENPYEAVATNKTKKNMKP